MKALRRAVAKGRRDGVGTAWREEVEMMVCTGRIRRRMANMKSPKRIFKCIQKDGYVLWNLEDTTDDNCVGLSSSEAEGIYGAQEERSIGFRSQCASSL